MPGVRARRLRPGHSASTLHGMGPAAALEGEESCRGRPRPARRAPGAEFRSGHAREALDRQRAGEGQAPQRPVPPGSGGVRSRVFIVSAPVFLPRLWSVSHRRDYRSLTWRVALPGATALARALPRGSGAILRARSEAPAQTESGRKSSSGSMVLLQGRWSDTPARAPGDRPIRACYIAKHENPAAGPSDRRGVSLAGDRSPPDPVLEGSKTVPEGARGRRRRPLPRGPRPLPKVIALAARTTRSSATVRPAAPGPERRGRGDRPGARGQCGWILRSRRRAACSARSSSRRGLGPGARLGTRRSRTCARRTSWPRTTSATTAIARARPPGARAAAGGGSPRRAAGEPAQPGLMRLDRPRRAPGQAVFARRSALPVAPRDGARGPGVAERRSWTSYEGRTASTRPLPCCGT